MAKKWTYEEYLDELKKPIDFPDPNNKDDPRYYRKYAHNVPPPAAYFYIPADKDKVSSDPKTKMARKVHFGWNNFTEYEIKGIKVLKKYVADAGCRDPPECFADGDWLKWM